MVLLLAQDKILQLCDKILINHAQAVQQLVSLKTCRDEYEALATAFIATLGDDEFTTLTEDKAWTQAETEPFRVLFINSKKPIVRNLAATYKKLWILTNQYIHTRERLPASLETLLPPADDIKTKKGLFEFDAMETTFSQPYQNSFVQLELRPRLDEDAVFEPDADTKKAMLSRMMHEKQIELVTFLQTVCIDQHQPDKVMVRPPTGEEYCFENQKVFSRDSKIVLKDCRHFVNNVDGVWSLMRFIELLQTYTRKQSMSLTFTVCPKNTPAYYSTLRVTFKVL